MKNDVLELIIFTIYLSSQNAQTKFFSTFGSLPLHSGGPLQEGVFHEKTAFEAWCWDKGVRRAWVYTVGILVTTWFVHVCIICCVQAYPVMAVSILGLVGGSAFGIHYMITSPDCKLLPGKTRSKMFRGTTLRIHTLYVVKFISGLNHLLDPIHAVLLPPQRLAWTDYVLAAGDGC